MHLVYTCVLIYANTYTHTCTFAISGEISPNLVLNVRHLNNANLAITGKLTNFPLTSDFVSPKLRIFNKRDLPQNWCILAVGFWRKINCVLLTKSEFWGQTFNLLLNYNFSFIVFICFLFFSFAVLYAKELTSSCILP